MGHCRKTVKEAMLVSAEEYNYLLRGYNEEMQAKYNVARWMSFNSMLLSPFIKHKPLTPEQYAPFPWDKPREIHYSKVTPEEVAELEKMKMEFLANKRR